MPGTTESLTPESNLRPTVVCAWCTAIMREGSPGQLSHGICNRCRRKVLRKFGVITQFADGRLAGVLGRIEDRGFELLRPRDEVLWLHFSAIKHVNDESVTLSCSEESLGDYVV